jgi:hypothetical protein
MKEPNTRRNVAFERVSRELLDIAGTYSQFVSGAVVELLKADFKPLRTESVTLVDAPEARDESGFSFFIHPPTPEELERALS